MKADVKTVVEEINLTLTPFEAQVLLEIGWCTSGKGPARDVIDNLVDKLNPLVGRVKDANWYFSGSIHT